MKKILCYGDSNTWGCSPADGSRFGEDVRWPMVMASCLGSGFEIIEDAKCGRTVLDLNSDPELNGISWIQSKVESYMPLYLAIICLGTNDVFDPGELPLTRILAGLEKITGIVRESHIKQSIVSPHIILLTPVMHTAQPEEMNFYRLQINKTAALIAEYTILARETGSLCLDISGIITASDKDGSHLERESHIKLGRTVAEYIKSELL
ncbi:MAG TPA: GDSL-type esterase/lipase family protein [Spirochaetota bacterium]|nr:GDSL-type esterase/lipase family protein [Spirochaetota bacterium]